MKKALSIVLVGALSLALFLVAGYARSESTASAALEQELAAMEKIFADLHSFMGMLVTEVKTTMGDIDAAEIRIGDLRDVITSIAVELKLAEGKILGLRSDVTEMAGVQQETRVRLAALEAGLAELAVTVDNWRDSLGTAITLTREDLTVLDDRVSALIADYNAFKDDYAAFRTSLAADLSGLTGRIDALDTRILAIEGEEIGLFKENTFAELSLLGGRLLTLEQKGIGLFMETTFADISALRMGQEDLAIRMRKIEDEDIGTFRRKVLQLERSMSALSIRIDNNRAGLDGIEHALAVSAISIEANRCAILVNVDLLTDHELRITRIESLTEIEALQAQVDTLYLISIVALLAGVGALIWGFLQ
ncbi:hypothetical protein LR032_05510 [Candidatus Bipolaricaulota bacterium]|nr:hypothetical protein [Candidatus Bipolaricaulota bacterium]